MGAYILMALAVMSHSHEISTFLTIFILLGTIYPRNFVHLTVSYLDNPNAQLYNF